MAIPVLGEIERWITEHGSAAVLKEHLSLLQAKLTQLKDDVARLERENESLRSRNRELELKAAASAEAFVEERGALFKRKANGGFHTAVYCPRCKTSASPFPPGEEFNCQCGWFSSFTERDLPSVLQSLTAA